MKIAIHVADLDHARIDGTRVYMQNVLKYLGNLAPQDSFMLYHANDFNPALAPQVQENYHERLLKPMHMWTQTRFALALRQDVPDVLWMPMANIPLLRRKTMRSVVTIHDLAFKHFPDYFPKKDLLKLNALAHVAITQADEIIAVSQATKNDILKFFPQRAEETVHVVHHGFDAQLFANVSTQEDTEKVLSKFQIRDKKYLLYVGAIQPRKNLDTLVEAFEKLKPAYPDLQLVLVGEKAWLWEGVMAKILASAYAADIICTGPLPFSQLPILYRHARAFVFSSLYEGFGIPVLEAFASGVPVIAANNSSLPEVAGDGALFFETGSSNDLAEKIEQLLGNGELADSLVKKAEERLAQFSWESCAQKTLDILRKKEYN